ncbi:MAG: HPr-rel-A system PqqD family peptide chaperone [Ignavibacteriaceae bacterium]|nr:HPr-rel-A system PqqD family peptide chaperone [Ignavibacteriaceae bacterium]
MKNFTIPQNVAVSDSGFLFLASTGETFNLNEQGTLIYKMLQNGLNNEEIVNQITAEYEISSDLFQKDLDDFLHSLKTFGLVKEL